MSWIPLAGRRCAALLALALLTALPASAQWQRVEAFMPVSDLYAVNLVGSDAEYAYATVLAGQPVPNRFEIVRSGDDGISWQLVFTGYNGGVRGTFLGDLGGQMAVLIQGGGLTGLLLSDDHGRTWAETPARMPTGQGTSVARDGDTYVVTGGNISYRSTNGGGDWTALEERAMAGVVFFGGSFYALDSIGQLFRLDGAAWTAIPFGASFATHLWLDGGQVWVKAAAGDLYASATGTAWSAQPTAAPTTWGRVLPMPDDGTPWFLHNQAAALDLLLSDDDGATATSIADGYPRDDNGAICTSNYAVSANAVLGNGVCSFTEPERNGVVRYVFGDALALGPLDPSFGSSGRVALRLFAGIEHGVAVLPAGGAGVTGGGGGMLLVGSFGSLARFLPDGTLDASYGTDGVAQPRVASAQTALAVADGALLLAGVGGVWRVLSDGTLDTSYGTDGVVDALSSGAAAFADGAVVLTGFYDPTGGSDRKFGLVKLTPDGTVDTAFGTDGYVFPADRPGGTGVTVDGQGRVVALFSDGSGAPHLHRYTASGAPDTAFGTGGVATVPGLVDGRTVATDDRDRVVFAARADFSSPVQVVRLTPDGSLDGTFGSGGLAEIPSTEDENDFPANPILWTLHVDADGAITLGGSIPLTIPVDDGVLGSQPAYLARLTEAGAMDATFGDGGQFYTAMSGRHDIIRALAFDADGRILAAGWSDTGFGQQDERAILLRSFTDVTSGGGDTAAETAPGADGLALDLWPNPSRGGATVRLRTEAGGLATVDLFDTLGRHVARLGDGVARAGEQTFAVPSGLAPGIYVVRAVVDGQVRARTLTVVR